MIGKILSFATIGSTLAGASLLHRFLATALNMLMWGIACAFALGAFMASLFVVSYFCMLRYGIDAGDASMALSIAALLLTGVLLVGTFGHFQKLRKLCTSDLSKHSDILPDIKNITAAFVDGFLDPKD